MKWQKLHKKMSEEDGKVDKYIIENSSFLHVYSNIQDISTHIHVD